MEEHDGSSSGQLDLRLSWDVFLSFRGPDSRRAFVVPLHDALKSHGVRAFLDSEGVNQGDSISPTLIAAIEDSAAAIVVVSRDYASSHWCLEEMEMLCKHRKLILPVFYGVEPRDVRHQRGPFQRAFGSHMKRFAEDRISRWKSAMKQVGEISGVVLGDEGSDREKSLAIQSLVQRIQDVLNNSPLAVAPFVVGLEPRIKRLLDLFDVKSTHGLKVLGLHGIGGVGKTTLAKSLFNKLVPRFQRRSFVPDVRESCARSNGSVVSLQEKILRDLSLGNVTQRLDETSASFRRGLIRQATEDAPFLLVLDDVDVASQLHDLLGRTDYYHKASRIIITTRNLEALDRDYVTDIYEVRELFEEDALRLFSYHALKRENPTEEFMALSKEIVLLSGKLPLALEVFGSFLVDKRRKKEWEDAVRKLQQCRPGDLQDLLKISYDGLDGETQSMFLDAACLFVKMNLRGEEAVEIWDGCNYKAKIGIRVLVSRSLMKITEDGDLWMHDQLRDLGREIVLHESFHDPALRSRLWDRTEIMTVLEEGKGTRNIQGIVLDYEHGPLVMDPSSERLAWQNFIQTHNFSSAIQYLCEMWKKCFNFQAEKGKKVMLRPEYFKPMINLRLLQINYMQLDGNFKFLPQSLKWLQWKECPLRILPSDFCPRRLAILDLSMSRVEHLWKATSNKVGENLMIINLSGCYNLAAVPDLSGNKSLKKLILEKCARLTRLHESIGSLDSLVHLNLRGCTELVGLPKDISGLKNLEELILSDCVRLKELPENIDSMKSLKILLLDRTAIAKLPEKIFHLEGLEKLDLNGCASLKRLTDSLGMLVSLKELILDNTEIQEIPNSLGSLRKLELLSLMWCFSLAELPDIFDHLYCLKKLFIDGSNIKELPASIGSLLYLKTLSIGDCLFSRNHPDSIRGLISVTELSLGGKSITSMPAQLGALKTLRRLEIRNCESLECLPESIGSLSFLIILIIVNASITELPESIGELDNLIELRLNYCKHLHKLPSSMGNLRSLLRLIMKETAVTMLPESTGRLTNLITLQMGKKPRSSNQGLPVQGNPEPSPLPFSLSNLSQLEELNAHAWYMPGKVHDDFEKLAQLEILDLGYNNFSCLPSSLKGLCILKKLLLPHCRELKSIPPLPSSLLEVDISDCVAVEGISDVSNLENLEELNMANCEKLVDFPGLQHLASLRRLFMIGCEACSSVVQRRISKVSLRNLSNLSMPGSEIPDWLSNEEVTCTVQKNRLIKAVLIGVVVSITDEFRKAWGDIPTLVGIQARVLKLDYPIYSAMLYLKGIPTSNGDHVHLCRFLDFHPLVLTLKDGYKVQLAKQDFPGLELKKCGVYMIYERDDDYKGDEQQLDDSYQSVSERLARFFNSL